MLRLAAGAALLPYVRVAYRIRGWGRLPRRRGPTLVIANHQHDLDSMAIMARLIVDGPWNRPLHTISSRRMFEPGFFAVRTPWVAPLARRYDASRLFQALGPMPIENDLRRRALSSVAHSIRRRHGNIALARVLPGTVLASLGLSGDVRIDDLESTRWFKASQSQVDLREVCEPHRTEIMDETRSLLREDLGRIEDALRAGATFFLTPEGHYTTDGRMLRFRDAYARLAPLADIWLAAISYDALRGRRLSQLYRIVRPERGHDAVLPSLKAARPVTVSQLLATWMRSSDTGAFTETAAAHGVRAGLGLLPKRLFVDPELERDPAAVTRQALETCMRLGVLVRDGLQLRLAEHRRHPRFPEVEDVVSYQARFLAETLEGAAALDAAAT